MIITYCYIGLLPQYAIDTVHQTRLFYNGDIYFIVSDLHSPVIDILREKYNVIIIDYNTVYSTEFNMKFEEYRQKFYIVPELKERDKLFVYAFERFFSLYHLMDQRNLDNVFFLELDNLIYDDPRNWETLFNKKDIAYMFDNYERFASGIFYVKNKIALKKLNDSFLHYISTLSTDCIVEMGGLFDFYEHNKNDIQILPTLWKIPSVPKIIYENFDDYNSIFDAAALGIYLGGIDPIHNKGIIKKGLKWWGSLLDYTIYEYDWKLDESGRKIPYILHPDTNEWIRINNLHIHSKKLDDCLSKSY